jgi:hypothetical protein
VLSGYNWGWFQGYGGEVRRCDRCHDNKEVAWIVDPYYEYMYNESIEKWLCEECYEELESQVG